VARYGDVVDALARACERAGVQVLRPLRVAALAEHGRRRALQLDDGRTLTAQVAVQAEGGVFGEQERAGQRDYGQTAVIARVSASSADRAPRLRALHRRRPAGPAAAGRRRRPPVRAGVVRAARRAPAPAGPGGSAFLHELGEAFGERLGRFTRVSRALRLPARPERRTARTARTVAIGNAAQTLHPVAGQGLNLGLRDAAVLARLLARWMPRRKRSALPDERAATAS
jgi:2-octaprenyl-6-methoxyphenol hydroxylase